MAKFGVMLSRPLEYADDPASSSILPAGRRLAEGGGEAVLKCRMAAPRPCRRFPEHFVEQLPCQKFKGDEGELQPCTEIPDVKIRDFLGFQVCVVAV